MGSFTGRRILVTGGAGFIGSHLTEQLLSRGHHVTVMDSLWTGSLASVERHSSNADFKFLRHDVTVAFPSELVFDEIYHLACPASPDRFPEKPVDILNTCFQGTRNVLELAKKCKARVLITSTSEIYGSSLSYPQYESDWGNVNSFGPRSCYDEGKRVAEALAFGYRHESAADVRIARIFNTYGPGLLPDDGRVVSNFIGAALDGKELVIYGDGKSTRCFQFVSDCVAGLLALMDGTYSDSPVNIGTDIETTVQELAEMVRDLVAAETGKEKVQIKYIHAKQDDPVRRKPSIALAKNELSWEPKVDLRQGLTESIAWYKSLKSGR